MRAIQPRRLPSLTIERLQLELRRSRDACDAAGASTRRRRTTRDLNKQEHSVGDDQYAVGNTEPFGGNEGMLEASIAMQLLQGDM